MDQLTALQAHYAKNQQVKDRQKAEKKKAEIKQALLNYQTTTVKKQEDELTHLQYLRDTNEEIRQMIAKCEEVVAKHRLTAEKKILYDDAHSVATHLHAVCANITDSHIKHLQGVFDRVKHFFISMEIDIKNRQAAASMALYLSLQPGRISSLHLSKGKHKAALMTVPPSGGKSIIIAQLAAMVLVGKPEVIDNVVVCFPNKVLLE